MESEIHGFCDKRFFPLREAFLANFDDGSDIGASLGVTWRGKMVVDLWCGWADPTLKKPWQKDTIVSVFSVSKIMLLMCVMKLVDRNKLDLDTPVARYWPAFGQGGKEKVTLREFLTHRGGVPIFQPPVTANDLRRWRRITSGLAAQPHMFGGENVLCYHPTTFGFVVGEIIRRVDGRYPNRFFREEIGRKARADFWLGLSSRWDRRRVARPTFVPPMTPEQLQAELPDFKVTEMGSRVHEENQRLLEGDLMSWKDQSLLSPSSTAYGNGRSIARLCAILANGGRLGWRRYVSRRMAAEAGREQVAGEDLYLGPIRWGLGVALDTAIWPAPAPTAFHWGGFGGAWAAMDPASRTSLGYAPNKLNQRPDDPRTRRLSAAFAGVIRALPH